MSFRLVKKPKKGLQMHYRASEETIENLIDRTGVKIGTIQTNELLEGIEMIEPKAREAFTQTLSFIVVITGRYTYFVD